MRYSLTFRTADYENLVDHLFSPPVSEERAAYLLCRTSKSDKEVRLLVQEVIPVDPAELVESSSVHMSIRSTSFMRAMKRAQLRRSSFVFVHSHPEDVSDFSSQDNSEETSLFKTAYNRIENAGPHASLVFSSASSVRGRVWLTDGSRRDMDLIRVIGDRFEFFAISDESPSAQVFDRQVRAFGGGIQTVLSKLVIGIVGAGGTGSAVAEQLIRLGVGTVYAFDGDSLDESNLTRVHESGREQIGEKKVKVIEKSASRVGMGKVVPIEKPITFRSAAELLRNCDVIFGCTDDQWGRSILTRLAVYYYIPVFDMGVRIDSVDGRIRSVQGRVTTLIPGSACLFCRGRLNANAVAAESIAASDPVAAAKLQREGYIPELEVSAPAVISFTTTVAAWAVCEFLHRLTSFMSDERVSTEALFLFDQSRVRTNSVTSDPNCFCADETRAGRGDCDPLLDLTWRPE